MFELGIHAIIEDSAIQKSLDSIAAVTGKTQGQVMRDRAPMFARYLAGSTQPVVDSDTGQALTRDSVNASGESKAAQQMGMRAVARDIARVYVSPAKIYAQLKNWSNAKLGASIARQFYKAIKSGNISEAQSILRRSGIAAQHLDIINWDGGRRHHDSRSPKNGRVNQAKKPVIVTDPKAVEAYVKKKMKRVGWAKSGWITAGSHIKPGSRVAAWMKQYAPADAMDKTSDPENPRMSLTNRVSYAYKVLRFKYKNEATVRFARSLAKETEHVLDYYARKEQARANSSR